MNKNLENQIKEELKEINQKNLTRKIDNLKFITSTRAIDENGKEYLVYGTNNYLGLTHHPDVIKPQALMEPDQLVQDLQLEELSKPMNWRKT